jgi:hypothetical protein
MSSAFYNPYQFVPVTGEINGDKAHRDRLDYAAIGTAQIGPGHTVRHDLWHADGLSGRIVCSLHLNTPTLVGAGQTPGHDGAALVEQYRWRDEPAIPASSLKGMTASVAEALSQSALRILGNGTISLRVPDAGSRVGTTRVSLHLTEHDYFKHIDTELVPWSKDREVLTPAELLFGAVEVNEQGANPDHGRNLAGRLRFHDALPAQTPVKRLPEPVMLRILASPKLPCPPMYFHLCGQRGGWISKSDLFDKQGNQDLRPNGRKFYLHHPQAQIDSAFWETRNPKERADNKLRCQPLAAGQTFHFHVDFDNLTRAELTLLEHALTPGPGFRHRLGLGKPLGLGSVTVAIAGVFLIDRRRRYGLTALESPACRYAECWRPEQTPRLDAPGADPATRADGRYAAEWQAVPNGEPPSKTADPQDTALIDRDTLKILLTLGDTRCLLADTQVHTPLTLAQCQAPASEDETFRWFNDNDKRGRQALRPVTSGAPLPPLFARPAEAHEHTFAPAVSTVGSAPPPIPKSDPAVAAWLAAAIPDQNQYPTKATAEQVILIEDKGLRDRVFAYLCRSCGTRGIYLDNGADRLYRKHGLKPNYD